MQANETTRVDLALLLSRLLERKESLCLDNEHERLELARFLATELSKTVRVRLSAGL